MTDAYVIPIRRSLTEPMLLAGIPRTLAIIGWTTVAALTLHLFAWWALVLGVVLHGVAAHFAAADPHFFDIAVRSVRIKGFYESC